MFLCKCNQSNPNFYWINLIWLHLFGCNCDRIQFIQSILLVTCIPLLTQSVNMLIYLFYHSGNRLFEVRKYQINNWRDDQNICICVISPLLSFVWTTFWTSGSSWLKLMLSDSHTEQLRGSLTEKLQNVQFVHQMLLQSWKS